jgi:transcription initiation factor TFIIA large subunit
MVTLDEYNVDRKGKKHSSSNLHLTVSEPSPSSPDTPKPTVVKQMDGGDDSDEDTKDNIELFELDEDAITSDLDDSADDGHDDADDGESAGHMMLCTYEKVQRVKNKWKCTLKDGVLTVNGKE